MIVPVARVPVSSRGAVAVKLHVIPSVIELPGTSILPPVTGAFVITSIAALEGIGVVRARAREPPGSIGPPPDKGDEVEIRIASFGALLLNVAQSREER